MRLICDDLNLGTVPETGSALDDHGGAGRDAVQDLELAAHVAADLHRQVGDRAVGIDAVDEALAGALLLDDRLVGKHDMVLDAEGDGDPGVHARPQGAVGIADDDLGDEGMRGGVHGRIKPVHAALEGTAGKGVGYDGDLVAPLDLGIFALGDAHLELDGDDLLHHEERLGHREEVALVIVAGGDIAGDRAPEDGIGLEVVHGGTAHVVGQFHGVEVALGDAAAGVQLLEALELRAVVDELEARLVELEAVHLGHDLAAVDIVAHLDVDLADAGRRLGGDVVDGIRFHRCRIYTLLADIARCGLHDLHGMHPGVDRRHQLFSGTFLTGLPPAGNHRSGDRRHHQHLQNCSLHIV